MRLVMVGSGYVGLVSGACFADFGHDVVCVDKLIEKINDLNAGLIPIFEPGLRELIQTNVAAGRLKFSTDLAWSVENADVVFIAVGEIGPERELLGRVGARHAVAEVHARVKPRPEVLLDRLHHGHIRQQHARPRDLDGCLRVRVRDERTGGTITYKWELQVCQ